jgi:predicted transcriptional regulator
MLAPVFIMAKIVIEGKEHTCSETVKQEIEWQDVRIATAIKLAKMIEDKQDEIEEFTRAKQSEIQDLINQLKAL